jgi:hypothetical protein
MHGVQTALEARTLSTGVYSTVITLNLRGSELLARFAPPQLLWFRGLTTTRPTNKLKCHKLRPRDHMHRLKRNSNTASTRPKRTKTPVTPMHLCASANQRRGLFRGFIFWSCPRPNEQAAVRSNRCQERDRYQNLSSGSTGPTGSTRSNESNESKADGCFRKGGVSFLRTPCKPSELCYAMSATLVNDQAYGGRAAVP